ncbi:MAG TPA: nitroreductase family deazaflavin-dependent oxidoreductase [Candidatus Limnocylindrales bacterium]|nr:nitroreductase family deazaflavin-dependent oxidoreductase [Candidatus Limnocylindrales bacterium]
MGTVGRSFRGIGGRILVRLGRAGFLTTTGRRSGQPRRTSVGVIPRLDGSFLIGAGGEGRHWVANLRADPRCGLVYRGVSHRCRAAELTGPDRDAAAAEMRSAMGRFGEQAHFVEVFVLRQDDEPG